jgi:hypothetical protein
MLVATRDPMHSPGAHDGSPRPLASRSSRFMTAMQIAGSVLAIPVGLGSAYSVYHANFSVETTCQTLRANIITMIDKKIDATARRMLVRHDVETFENTCATVDPDAAAAFKTLLAEPPAHIAAPVAKRIEMPKVEPKAEGRAEPKTEPAKEARKPELRAAVPAEPVREQPKERAKEAVREPVKEAPKEPARAADAVQQHDAVSDARWLDAVRGALVAHEKQANAEAAADAAVSRGAPPHPLALPPPPVAAAPITAAPALPPPTQVAEPVRAAAPAADPDRLVPPAPIPEQSGPKPTGWVSKVPFVGQMLAK